MFYNHLGFYGENLKVAMLEYYIEQSGKTEEFRRVFEQKKGKPWVEMRRAFAFNGKFIIPTLMEVLDMSEDDAKKWFNDKTATELSIVRLFATPWTSAYQAPLSTGFARQEYWSGVPSPSLTPDESSQ